MHTVWSCDLAGCAPMKRVPFYAFSSYNKRGGKAHPLTLRRRNQALDMWAEMRTVNEIAEALGVDNDTVRSYIRRGRVTNDPRAYRVVKNRHHLQAALRRRQIGLLHNAGMTAQQIADRLNVNIRLVQIRLKEAGGGNR